jgi:transketolase
MIDANPQMTTMDERSRLLRRQILKTMHAGRRGHIGSALSIVEIVRVLYDDILNYDPANPTLENRDRFILSKGHGCLALYVVLAEKGFFPEDHLWTFCKPESMLGGHPERGKIPGVEASTGSLGHGFSIGVGLALSLRLKRLPSRVFVLTGDGELNEGSNWESAMSAAKHGLDSLTLIVDCNKQQSYDYTSEVLDLEPLAEKWRAFGFEPVEVNGHDVDELRNALKAVPFRSGKPSAIIAHTVKGKGVPQAEKNLSWHHKNKFSDDELDTLLKSLEQY